ncbi:phosphotyrosine-specific ptp2-like protein, partial [Coemansia sp. RSA 2424]
MRKSCDYVNSHIVSAIGMTVPTTLVKRANFSVQRLMTMLHASEAQKQQLAHWKQAPWIAIYGEGTYEDTASEDALLVLLARKFMGEAPPGSSCNVYVLEGGYAEFSRLYPAMCEYGDSAGGRKSVVGELAPLPLPAAISALEEPDMLTVDLDHPMLRKLRQTPGGGCDPNEVISMRMPPEFAALKSSALM